MQKIVPHLWFDTQAKAAAEFYASVFPNSRVIHTTTLHDTPSGDSDIVSFEINGFSFMAISAGPHFKVNPSISFMVNFDPAQDTEAQESMDRIWSKLEKGGKVLMPLQEYDFSKRYGWIEDTFGVSWQLILTDPEGEPRPFIMPSMLFTKEACGKAEAAIKHYTSIFKDSKVGTLARYPAGMAPEKEGTLMFGDCLLANQWFTAMDSAQQHDFIFNEAVSLMVKCVDQTEIDYFWEKLSAVPAAEQCGWLKDEFGISWQIVPEEMERMMTEGTPEQIERVTKAFLPMKKFDLAELQRAYDGN